MSASAAPASTIGIKGLHHFAWRCRDGEETRQFYEGVLGLPLAHIIKADIVPSTGEFCPYVHLFFQFRDGSYIAFFDLGDDMTADPSPNTPAWVNHFAMEVDSRDELLDYKKRLEDAGIEVLGITDHHFINSIYFFDPNGIRLELTIRTVPDSKLEDFAKVARQELDAWTAEKAQRRKAAAQAAE